MVKNGRSLEKAIRLIQETFKDSEDTKIYSNIKLKNIDSLNREVDILIVTKVNEVEIKIAIECKDHNRKISIEQIESFETKCNSLKEINKKIFVSSNGYQSGAITAAKRIGIDLYIASQVTVNIIKDWLPEIAKISLQILSIPNKELYLDTEEENLNEILANYNGYVFIDGDDTPMNIEKLLVDFVNSNKHEIWRGAIIEFMRLTDASRFQPYLVKFKLGFDNYHICCKNNEKIKLFGIVLSVSVKFVQSDLQIINGRRLTNPDGNIIANTATVDLGSNYQGDFVINKRNELNIFTTENTGIVSKMELLLSYNPDTKTYSDSKNKD